MCAMSDFQALPSAAEIPFSITHAPGAMLATELKESLKP
jgi:uncharacterized protein YcsI (UPF0317 family)